MSGRNLLSLRRLPQKVTDPGDQVVAESIGLHCTRCGHRWAARLGVFRDEIEPGDTDCPSCTPAPPKAA